MFKMRLLPLTIASIVTSGLAAAQEQAVDEEIVVQGVRSAEINALEEERKKDVFSSIISRDDAGNFADQNVAESLQRLPGITLQKSEGEGKFVNLRGLGPGFVSVNMNGSEVANAGGGPEDDEGRGFGLDSMPADLLGSIEVLKSLTPDMDLNSIGGTINVKTSSPLDAGKNKLKVTAQGYFQEFAEEPSPKLSLQGSNVFLGNTLGIGYSLSYEERTTETYETRHHNDNSMRYINANFPGAPASSDVMLIPFEIENREEDAERERVAGALDIEFRPTDTSEYYIRGALTKLTDQDIALREYYRFGQANAGGTAPFAGANTTYLDPSKNIFGVVGADLQHQYFIQESDTTTEVLSLGGENVIGGSWTLDYDYTRSVGELDKPDARRVQFRSRFLPMLGQSGRDFINGQIISSAQMSQLAGVTIPNSAPGVSGIGGSGYLVGERVQPNMEYDNIFIEDSFREDTLNQIAVNLRKDFNSGIFNYFKTGFMIKERERDRDKDRWSVVPSAFAGPACSGDVECLVLGGAGTLGDFSTYTPNNPAFDHDFITFGEAERLLAATSRIARFTDPANVDQESRKEDYLLTEDSAAAYFMTELQLSESSTLIVGARYDQTDFASDGNLTIRNDRLEVPGNPLVLDVAIPIQDTSTSYSDIFPSIHYRNELRDDLLLRASLWTSFSRPSFDDARAFAEFEGRVVLCNNNSTDPDFGECSDNPSSIFQGGSPTVEDIADFFVMGSGNVLSLGNPGLVAMTSTNLDLSLGWYAGEDLFLQAALFYKDIDDFIVDVTGASVAINELPISLPIDQVSQFTIPADLRLDSVNFHINGDSAEVYGLELAYSQYFTSGFLDGFFVQSNLTLIDSKARVGDTIRTGEIKLPEQADHTLNLTLGWENDDISARLIGNYRSEILKRIGSCNAEDIQADQVAGLPLNCQTWSDVYHDDTAIIDFKATYQITNNIKFYFDALNITEAEDIQYFRGNRFSGGNVLFRSEEYGTAFQIGVNVKIY